MAAVASIWSVNVDMHVRVARRRDGASFDDLNIVVVVIRRDGCRRDVPVQKHICAEGAGRERCARVNVRTLMLPAG